MIGYRFKPLILLYFLFIICSSNIFAAPLPPTPQSVTQDNANSLKFTWSATSNASTYFLAIYGKNADGSVNWSNKIFDDQVLVSAAACNTTNCNKSIPTSSLEGFWKIQVVLNDGQKSTYSDFVPFTVTPVTTTLTVPEIVSPKQTSSTTDSNNITFKWKPVTNATSYYLAAYEQNASGAVDWTKVIADKEILTNSISCSTECSYQYPSTVRKGFWKIRAIFANGAKSDYSAFVDFVLQTTTVSNIPIIKNPIGLVTTGNPISFEWEPVANAYTYYISVYRKTSTGALDTTLPIFDGQALSVDSCTSTVCKTTITINETTGFWKIKALFSNGTSGNYSNYADFTLSTTNTSYTLPSSTPYTSWVSKVATSMLTPDFLNYRIDPDTNKKVWRLGGSEAEMKAALATNAPDPISIHHAQHFYSRTVPTNKSETYVISAAALKKSRAALWRLSDKKLVKWVTASTVDTIPNAPGEIQEAQRHIIWDKNADNVYWYTQGNSIYKGTIDFTNLSNNSEPVLHDTFSDYKYISFGFQEGNFSDDGKKIVIIGTKVNAVTPETMSTNSIIPYDISTKTKGTPFTPNYSYSLNWAGVDPTGQYIVYDEPKTASNMSDRNTWVTSFNNPSSAPKRVLYSSYKHCDFVVDKQGLSWVVYGNYKGVYAVRLDSQLLKRVWPVVESSTTSTNHDFGLINTNETASGHVSRVKEKPGFALISRYMDGGLYYIDIDNPAKTIYLGNTRHGDPCKACRLPDGSLDKVLATSMGVDDAAEPYPKDYKREPRGSASSSGRYIFFTSDYYIYKGQYNNYPEYKSYLNMIDLGS